MLAAVLPLLITPPVALVVLRKSQTPTNAGGAANQSTSEGRMNLEQARTALQNNDTQSAMMYLDMALSTMGGSGDGTQGNITSSTAGGGNTTTGG